MTNKKNLPITETSYDTAVSWKRYYWLIIESQQNAFQKIEQKYIDEKKEAIDKNIIAEISKKQQVLHDLVVAEMEERSKRGI